MKPRSWLKKKKELILKLKQLKIKAQDRIKEGESDKKRGEVLYLLYFLSDSIPNILNLKKKKTP